MSDRTSAKSNDQPLPSARVLYDGVPTETSDRRAIAMWAFALDEAEDPIAKTDAGGEGLVAFLPAFCSTSLSWAR